MYIVILNATMTHGGAERVIANLSKEIILMGHTLELLLYYDRPIWYQLDPMVKITIDEQYIKGKSVLSHMMWRRKYISKVKPDVIISFLAPFNMVNIVAMLGLKIPLIVADRNDPKRVPKQRVLRLARNVLYRFADRVVLQSEDNKNYFSRTIQKKSTVIFNPIDLGDYKGIALHTEKKKKIVFIGRIIRQKNPLMLLEAFRLISQEYPEYALVYYGEGDMREAVKAKADAYGFSDRVALPGAVIDVFEKTKDAELFVMTSDYEGMPNALLEAMCMGLPVISTRVSGATDVIVNGVNGMLVDCNNASALAEAMRKMLSNEDYRKNCGKHAAELACKLEIKQITNKWMESVSLLHSIH